MLLGVTGGIASGKSSVSHLLSMRMGAAYISADDECRSLLKKNKHGWEKIVTASGNLFLSTDGNIDRAKLRKAIFDDHDVRRLINHLLHPLVRKVIKKKILKYSSDAARSSIVIEVPLLFEADWMKDYDRIVVVYASPSVIQHRLRKRDNLSAIHARKTIDSQMSLMEKALLADHVIDNSGVWALTTLQVIHLVDAVLKKNSDSK